MPHLLIIEPDGTMRHEPAPAEYWGQRDLRLRLQVAVGGDPEIVWVHYKGKRTCMIVNETGATDLNGPVLEANKEATRIYWAASMCYQYNIPGSEDERYDALFESLWGIKEPMIHGTAVVMAGVKVK